MPGPAKTGLAIGSADSYKLVRNTGGTGLGVKGAGS